MENNEIQEELKRLKNAVKRRVRTIRKSLNKMQDRLQECESWKTVYHAAELLQTKFHELRKGLESIAVEDWENGGMKTTLMLDKRLTPQEEVASRFKKARKLKHGLSYAIEEEKRLKSALEDLQQCALCLENVETAEDLELLHQIHTLPKPQVKAEKKELKEKKPFLEFRSEAGILIWVGRNAESNDQLTFRSASGNDVWLHVSEMPGSHVVIHPEAKQEVDEATLREALQLALYHSSARRFGSAEVVVTKVKHVRRLGREKGKVQISNEKRYLVYYIPLP